MHLDGPNDGKRGSDRANANHRPDYCAPRHDWKYITGQRSAGSSMLVKIQTETRPFIHSTITILFMAFPQAFLQIFPSPLRIYEHRTVFIMGRDNRPCAMQQGSPGRMK
jgi:hypothetical protein